MVVSIDRIGGTPISGSRTTVYLQAADVAAEEAVKWTVKV